MTGERLTPVIDESMQQAMFSVRRTGTMVVDSLVDVIAPFEQNSLWTEQAPGFQGVQTAVQTAEVQPLPETDELTADQLRWIQLQLAQPGDPILN